MLRASLLAVVALLLTTSAASPEDDCEDEGWYQWDDGYPSSTSVNGNPYQPVQTSCPRHSLVRTSDDLNPKEAEYISRRKHNADRALEEWLSKLGDFDRDDQPTVAFASSGGGLRAFLEAAGIVQAFDGRDGDAGTNGLYQAFTYQSGISGGSWFVASLAGNNWPTITDLKQNLWDTTFQELIPADSAAEQASPLYSSILDDVRAKQDAGYQTTLIDPFGRWVAHGILFNENVNTYLSSIADLSNFREHNVPFPLYTSVGSQPDNGQCFPLPTSPQYEFTPFEFGSWDTGVEAFTDIEYLGSALSNGEPIDKEACTIHYDNLGYTFGASSNIFPKFYCFTTIEETPLDIVVGLEDLVKEVHNESSTDIFALFPNPFHNFEHSSAVANETDLYLNDGGFWGSDIPIWPFIQKSRDVDVIIAADISEDSNNFPNGFEMRWIYDNAQSRGLTKMPFIPTADVFVSQGLNTRATFFGCNQTDVSFIIYLPNVAYTYPTNQSSLRVSYAREDTDGMIANGVLIGTQNNDPEWPLCLACGVKNKGSKLPAECDACFQKYCYYQ